MAQSLSSGFEAGFVLSGVTQGFNSSLANLDAFTLEFGTSFTVSANLVSNPNTAQNIMSFGHPEWWDLPSGFFPLPAYVPNRSQVRFKWATSGTFRWYLRWKDINNWVRVTVDGSATLLMEKFIAGVYNSVTTSAITALTTGTFYWLRATVVDTTFTCGLYADSAGSVGAQNGSDVIGIVSDSAVAYGKMAIDMQGSASLQFGGAFADVCVVTIPRPADAWFASDDQNRFGSSTAISKVNVLTGTYSVSAYNTAAQAGPANYSYWSYAGFDYAASVYLASYNYKLTGATIGVRFGDHDLDNVSPFRSGTTGWTREVFRFTRATALPASTPYVILYGTGTAWWDNISLGLSTGGFDWGGGLLLGLYFTRDKTTNLGSTLAPAGNAPMQTGKPQAAAIKLLSPDDYGNVILADVPNVYYRLDESSGTSATDSSGNGNTGTYTGTVTYSKPGVSNTSVLLDGATAYVTRTKNAFFNIGDVFSVEMWVRLNTLPAAAGFQLMMSNGTGSFNLAFLDTGRIRLRKAGTADIVDSTSGITPDGNFHHIAVTKNGASVHLYIDNVDVTGTVVNQTLIDNAIDPLIGRSSTGQFLDGNLDEFALYPTELSATRVAARYNYRNGLRRQTGKALPATLPFIGAITRAITHVMPATQVLVGVAAKQTRRAFTATAALVGAVTPVHIFNVALAATLALTGAITKRTGKALTATLVLVGTAPMRTSRTLTATLVLVGAVTKQTRRLLSALLNIGKNRVQNSSFEDGLNNWTVGGAGTSDTTTAYHGTKSAKITATVYNYIFQSIPLPIGSYVGSVYLKTSSDFTADAAVGIRIENGTATLANANYNANPGANQPFTRQTMTFDVTAAGAINLILTNTYGGTATGTIWFDAVQLENGTVATEYDNIFKQTNRPLAATLALIGTVLIAMRWGRLLSATLVLTGTITRKTNKALTATLALIGAVTKAVAYPLTGTLNFIGAVTKQTRRSLVATLAFVGTVIQLRGKFLQGTLVFIGAQTKQTTKALPATLALIGTATKRTTRLVAAILAFAPYKAVVMSDAPVAYWRLGETSGLFLDQAGTRTGTSVGGQTRGLTGAIVGDDDRAPDFDGNDDYIDIAATNLGLGDVFSVEAWINPGTGALAGRRTYFSTTAANTANAISLEVGNTSGANLPGAVTHCARVIIPGIYMAVTPDNSIVENAWQHLVYTKTGSDHHWYINGVDAGMQFSDPRTCSDDTTTNKTIGVRQAPNQQIWFGGIDEVAIYSTVLSPTRVAAHYAAGTIDQMVKQTRRTIAAILSFIGATARAALYPRTLVGTLALNGTIIKRAGKATTATLVSSGVIQRAVGKSLVATAVLVGSTFRFITQTRGSTVGLIGAAYKQTLKKPFGGVLAFFGTESHFRVVISAMVNLFASLSLSGTVKKRPGKSLVATLGLSGQTVRGFIRGFVLTATLALAGSLSPLRRLARLILGLSAYRTNLQATTSYSTILVGATAYQRRS